MDTSALVAVLQDEPERDAFLTQLLKNRCLICAPTKLETYISRWRRTGPEAASEAVRLMNAVELQTIPFDDVLLLEAMKAFDVWGRGRGKANLNFGDCFSYALAKARGLPLLFKGEDFRRTDIQAAI